MKKTISLMLALASISSMGVSAMAANDMGEPMVIAPAPSVVATAQRQFVVNGKAMQLDSCTTENGTLMVPVRALAEALGFKVTWNNGEVNINDGEMQCDLRIGEENYFVYTAIKDAVGMSAPFTLGSARTTRPMCRSSCSCRSSATTTRRFRSRTRPLPSIRKPSPAI